MSSITQEHRGLAKVHSVCAEMDSIWRPTQTTDLGIDGQIEFLEPGTAISTGHLVAVQVKSGPSYFGMRKDGEIAFYPTAKHRLYWARLQLPVILILHNPIDELSVYSRVKPQLLTGGPIHVSLDCLFEPSAREKLISTSMDDLNLIPSGQVLQEFLKATYSIGEERGITGIHFLLASVDPTMSYLEIRMCRIIELIELVENSLGISFGTDTYEYLFRCITLVSSHKLTEPFIDEFYNCWYDLKMVPDMALALTPKGVAVLEHLWTNVDLYVGASGLAAKLGYSNAAALAHDIAEAAQYASVRLDASDRLGEFPL